MRRLSHTPPEPETPETVGAAIERCARSLARAHVHFGHGTDNPRDEAAELVFYAARLPHAQGSAVYGEPLSRRRRALPPMDREPWRSPHTRYGHGFGRDRAGVRRGLSARPRRRGRHLDGGS